MENIVKKNQLLVFGLPANESDPDVREIRGHIVNPHARQIQYLEMKQMIDIMGRFRTRMRNTICQYRCWALAHSAETDEIERAYSAYEGIFIRQQLRDCWRMYVTVNRDYHEMRRVYLASLCQPPHRRAAS